MKRILLLLSFAVWASAAFAQNWGGISVKIESAPMIVYVNGEPVSDITYSCFIANLPSGRYRISVEIPRNSLFGRSGQTVFDRTIHYRGNGVQVIDVERFLPRRDRRDPRQGTWDDGYAGSGNRAMMTTNSEGRLLRPIPNSTYNSLVKELKRAFFESDVRNVFRLFASDLGVTAEQFKALCKIPSFDGERKIVAMNLITHVIDIENCRNMGEVFSFISTRDEVDSLLQKEFEARNGRSGSWSLGW